MEENFVLDEDLKERVEKTKKCAMYGMMLLIGGFVFAEIISLINSLLNWHFLEELSLFSVMATYVAAWVVGVRFKAVKITFKAYVRLWLRFWEVLGYYQGFFISDTTYLVTFFAICLMGNNCIFWMCIISFYYIPINILFDCIFVL